MSFTQCVSCNKDCTKTCVIKARHSNTERSFKFIDIVDPPIDQELTRYEQIYNVSPDKFPIIPFYGNSQRPAHHKAFFIASLLEYSTTLSSVVNQQIEWAFGGTIDVIKARDINIHNPKSEAVSDQERKAYVEFLDSIEFRMGEQKENNYPFEKTQHNKTKELARHIQLMLDTTGNAWVQMDLVEIDGLKKIYLIAHNSLNCAYANLERTDIEGEYAVISEDWSVNYLNEIPPDVVAVHPNYSISSKGKAKKMSTVFHLKQQSGTRRFYGVPRWISAYLRAYNEFQSAEYQVEQENEGYGGKHIIELEEGEQSVDSNRTPEDAQQSYQNQMEGANNMVAVASGTRKKRKSLAVTTRPPGAKSMSHIHIPANTDAAFFELKQKLNEVEIIKTMGSNRLLLGTETPKGGIGNDTYTKAAIVHDKVTIKPIAIRVASFIEKMLTDAKKFTSQESLIDYSIKFVTRFDNSEADSDATGIEGGD